MAEHDLLFQHLFFPTEDGDDSELAVSVYSDESNKISDGVHDPVGAFFRKAADEQITKSSGSSWSWNEPVNSTAPLHKRETDDADRLLSAAEREALYKSVVRTEKRTIDGEGTWLYAYNAKNEAVDIRVVGANAA